MSSVLNALWQAPQEERDAWDRKRRDIEASFVQKKIESYMLEEVGVRVIPPGTKVIIGNKLRHNRNKIYTYIRQVGWSHIIRDSNCEEIEVRHVLLA